MMMKLVHTAVLTPTVLCSNLNARTRPRAVKKHSTRKSTRDDIVLIQYITYGRLNFKLLSYSHPLAAMICRDCLQQEARERLYGDVQQSHRRF